ncbi:hypothetical protein EV356DRAFT_535084 [Viridothelium virens]|uniref:Fungal N-terminal domain-containing protein n=1 Tax=Viridothelium virens TaxID=1048519 RepID=A0A6A6H1Q7_VIRVR|nr:hypothetical protein EV356DRAFT_535084 [Viridothelium virens]
MENPRSRQGSHASTPDSIPSIGDILMLSQIAWKIGRAFSSGRRSSPAEFKEIESELNALSKSLKSFAETLFAEDENILSQAGKRAQNGVAIILLSCQQTLQDLESLVEQYQVIRRTETSGGYTVDRSWSELVLTNFGQMMWTTEGGSIHSLKTMLHMHTSTISVTVQALQEKSVERLENTVTPMADKVEDIHKRPDSDLNGKIEDVQNWVMAYAHTNPPPPPSSRGREGSIAGSIYSYSSSDPSERERERQIRPSDLSPQSERKPFSLVTPQRTPELVGSEASSVGSPLRGSGWGSSESSSAFETTDSTVDGRGPPSSLGSVQEQDEAGFGGPIIGNQSRPSQNARRQSSRRATPSSRRSGIIAPGGLMELEAIAQPPFFRQVSKDAVRQKQQPLPSPSISPESQIPIRTTSLSIDTERTPPSKPTTSIRATPVSTISSISSRATPQPYPDSYPVHDHSDDPIPVTTPPPDIPVHSSPRTLRSAASNHGSAPSIRSGRSYSTSAPTVTEHDRPSTPDQEEFERELFKNSAILCDLPVALVEYTQPSKDESKPWETQMISATKEARMCVVRKRNTFNDTVRFTTSIWSIARDRSARMEQRIVDGDAIVPYSSFFSPEKVSVTIPTELRFHDANPKDPNAEPRRISTTWVNYVFQDPRAGNMFQSVLFGRKLLAVFRTEKTLRLREGLKGALAYQEQMCGMENLRLWEDEGSCGVLAMMHFSAHFKDGYLSFWLNSSKEPVRVREESGKVIKVKGLNIPVEGTRGANGLMRRGSEGGMVMGIGLGTGKLGREGSKLAGKKITGARIEFRTEEDRDDFVAFVGRVQDRMVSIPEWDEGSTRS